MVRKLNCGVCVAVAVVQDQEQENRSQSSNQAQDLAVLSHRAEGGSRVLVVCARGHGDP